MKAMQQNTKNDKSRFDAFLDVNQAALFLGIAKATLYGKCCNLLISHLKKGKKLYFDNAELLNWLKSGKRKTIKDINESVNTHLFYRKIN